MPAWHNLVLRKIANLVSARISRFKSGRRRMKEKKHGILVIIWAILLLINSGISVPIYLLTPIFTGGSANVYYFLAGLSIANLILISYVLMWQKWAFYGYCVTALAVVIVNVVLMKEYGLLSSLSLLGPGILYLVMLKEWKLYN